jgi:NAD(P)-dependent dehydrogenase (short-subunit alcohol dehydrogenase family)
MPDKGPNNWFDLSGRTAVVTGGTAGIGKMIAQALLSAGAKVWIVARNADRVKQVAAALGEQCLGIAADVSTQEGVRLIRDEVAGTGMPLDILVNNAGISRKASFDSFPPEYWDDVLALNVKAPFQIVQALHPLLRRSSRAAPVAHILNIGSGAGISTRCDTSFSYYASKAALHHLSQIMATNFLSDRIHVNVIAPGYFHTELIDQIAPDEESLAKLVAMVPAGRFGGYDDIGALAVSIVSSSFMTGAIIPLDGGYLLKN